MTSAAVGGALVVGVTAQRLRHRGLAAGRAGVLNAYVRIEPSGRITLVLPKVEMGQGTYTSLPMLVAEELEVELDAITVEPAPPDPAVYGFPVDADADGFAVDPAAHRFCARSVDRQLAVDHAMLAAAATGGCGGAHDADLRRPPGAGACR